MLLNFVWILWPFWIKGHLRVHLWLQSDCVKKLFPQKSPVSCWALLSCISNLWRFDFFFENFPEKIWSDFLASFDCERTVTICAGDLFYSGRYLESVKRRGYYFKKTSPFYCDLRQEGWEREIRGEILFTFFG